MSHTPLTLVAIVHVKQGQRDFVRSEIIKLLTLTRKEQGCLEYTLHHDNKNSNIFVLYERWATYELWQAHMQSAHLKEFAQVTKQSVTEVVIHELTKCAE